jgi:hypothetical protein
VKLFEKHTGENPVGLQLVEDGPDVFEQADTELVIVSGLVRRC